MLSILCANQAKRIQFPDLMALPHQDNRKDEWKDLNKRHGAITPRKAQNLDPLRDIECDRETEPNAKCIQHNRCFLDVVREAFGEVVDRDGRDAQRPKGDQDLREAQESPWHVRVEAEAEEANAKGVAD